MISWCGNNWCMIGRGGVGNNWGSMDSMSHNWSSMDSMSHNWSSMDGMVNWGMDGMGNNWGSMHSMGKWGMDTMVNWGNGVKGGNSSWTNSNWSVSTNGRLDLRKTLGIVYLGH